MKWRLVALYVIKDKFFCLFLKSPTHLGFDGVKTGGRKSHTWAPLKAGTVWPDLHESGTLDRP